jgi:hypothetical protein
VNGANNTATLWFAVSGAARSNGVLNAGYIGFQMLHRAYHAIFLKKHTFVSTLCLHPPSLSSFNNVASDRIHVELCVKVLFLYTPYFAN